MYEIAHMWDMKITATFMYVSVWNLPGIFYFKNNIVYYLDLFFFKFFYIIQSTETSTLLEEMKGFFFPFSFVEV